MVWIVLLSLWTKKNIYLLEKVNAINRSTLFYGGSEIDLRPKYRISVICLIAEGTFIISGMSDLARVLAKS